MSANELVMRVSSSMMWLILHKKHQSTVIIDATLQQAHACAAMCLSPQHHSVRALQELGVHGNMRPNRGGRRVRWGQDDVGVVGVSLLQADGEVGGARRNAVR